MLAQNFMTPAQLKISSKEFDALFKVLGMLEREEVPDHLFNMHFIGQPDCGTPGCILGWALTQSTGRKLFDATERSRSLHALFYPAFAGSCLAAYEATRSQAATALRNYLTHGEPRWQEVMS